MDRFNVIFSKVFPCPKKAIAYCQNLSRLCGFSVRIRTSKTTSIYIVCSREGLNDPIREQFKKRSRNSGRCNCDWKIVLFKHSQNHWEFRSGKSTEHNHVIYSSEDVFGVEDKSNLIKEVSQAPVSSNASSSPPSPLPPLKSLNLPLKPYHTTSLPKGFDGLIYTVVSGPEARSCDSNNNYAEKPIDHLPPLTRALSKIMDPYVLSRVPEGKSRLITSISFLLN